VFFVMATKPGLDGSVTALAVAALLGVMDAVGLRRNV
jgi:acid phosphatase family membrane protein YuiD